MNLKHQVLSYFQIAETANHFLSNYHPSQSLPIPIEIITERDLKLEIIPVVCMKEKYDVDGCLDSTLTKIFVDMDRYMYHENRSRFTIAHEVGHLVLHKEIFSNLAIRSEEDIHNFTVNTKEDEFNWLQFQASTFAGVVLVPRAKIIEEVQNRIQKPFETVTFEKLLPIFSELERSFKVSGEVLMRRLEKEGICKPESTF